MSNTDQAHVGQCCCLASFTLFLVLVLASLTLSAFLSALAFASFLLAVVIYTAALVVLCFIILCFLFCRFLWSWRLAAAGLLTLLLRRAAPMRLLR